MEWKPETTNVDRETVDRDGVVTQSITGTSRFSGDTPEDLLVADFRRDHDGLTVVRVEVAASKIDGQVLRSISIPSIAQAILDELDKAPTAQFTVGPEHNYTALREHWPDGDKRELLLSAVQHVYNRSVERQQPARKAVADRFQVSRATAGRMISAARESGRELRSPAPYPGKRKGTRTDGEATT